MCCCAEGSYFILSCEQSCSNAHISSEPNSLSLKQGSLFADISQRAANALHYAELNNYPLHSKYLFTEILNWLLTKYAYYGILYFDEKGVYQLV